MKLKFFFFHFESNVLYACSSKFFSSFIHFNKLGKKVIELVIDCTASLEYSKLNVPAQLYSRLPSEQQRRLMHLVLNFLLHQVQKRGLGTLAFPFSCADALCWVSLSLACVKNTQLLTAWAWEFSSRPIVLFIAWLTFSQMLKMYFQLTWQFPFTVYKWKIGTDKVSQQAWNNLHSLWKSYVVFCSLPYS